MLFDIGGDAEYSFEPGLPKAPAALSQRQRLAVVLVHGYGYTLHQLRDPARLQRTLRADGIPAKVYHPVGADLGYGVDSYSLYLVNAAPGCTGS